jgi:hypothetical protein
MPIRTNRGRVAVYRRIWGWPMRSPRHLIITLLVIAAFVLAVGLIIPRLGGSGGGSPNAAANLGSSSNSTQTTQNIGQGGAPQTTKTPVPTSSLTTRLSGPTQSPTTAAAAPAALDVASTWAKAWVNHPQGISNQQWLDGLRPYTTEEQLAVMNTVEPANIRATAVTGNPTVTSSYTSSVEVTVPTNAGTLKITVIATPQGWRVAGYDQAG